MNAPIKPRAARSRHPREPARLKIKVPFLLEAEGEGTLSVVAVVVVVTFVLGFCAMIGHWPG